jgi:hypothetical protein
MKELTIDRSKWVCGNYFGDDSSFLLNPQIKRMCCLGFLCRSLGWKKSEITDLSQPGELLPVTSEYFKTNIKPKAEFLFRVEENPPFGVHDSNWTNQAMRINDDKYITQKEREKTLKALFKEVGWKLKFTGRLGKPNDLI